MTIMTEMQSYPLAVQNIFVYHRQTYTAIVQKHSEMGNKKYLKKNHDS